MNSTICSCICEGIHVANVFEYVNHEITMNKVALISINTIGRGFKIGLEHSTKTNHARPVGRISTESRQERLYPLVESRMFVRIDIFDVREEIRMATNGKDRKSVV